MALMYLNKIKEGVEYKTGNFSIRMKLMMI